MENNQKEQKLKDKHTATWRAHLGREDLDRLMAIPVSRVHQFVADAIELCPPAAVVVADDIACFRPLDGEFRAVHAEAGLFGIIQNASEKSDPAIWDVLTKPGEVIFSNVLVKDGRPFWLGMGVETPTEGENFTGRWFKSKKDASGADIPPAHKNAWCAVAMKALSNRDPEQENPGGVVLDAIVYGGRDMRAYGPVQQSFDWEHGIVSFGVCLETETAFAITACGTNTSG